MSTDRNKALVRRFVEAVNSQDYRALEAVVGPDFERHCPATPDVMVRSLEDFCRFLERDRETFPDERVDLETVVAEGDLVGFWATFRGTQSGPLGPFPASGRQASVEFGGVFRIVQGRIREVRLTWDNLGLLRQLGYASPAPPPG